MKISGLQKMTLLDYPGKVACTVFLQGCNFRCPFCHNSELLGATGPEGLNTEELMAFLKKRVGLLDGVCITGGEPTLQSDLVDLIQAIKELGYLVKLDTNGTRPEVVKTLAEKKLIDYVAMDIKNGPDAYPETAGAPHMDLTQVEQTMQLLLQGELDYEFRTTVVEQLHSRQTIESIGKWLEKLAPNHKAKRIFLQSYMDRDTVLMGGLSAPTKEKMQEYQAILAPFAKSVELRGID